MVYQPQSQHEDGRDHVHPKCRRGPGHVVRQSEVSVGGGTWRVFSGDTVHHVSLFSLQLWRLLLENEQLDQEDWHSWKVHIHEWAWVHVNRSVQHSQWTIHSISVITWFVPLSGWGNQNDMRIVDVKYNEYALTHTIKTKGDVITVVNKLYGKVIVSVNPSISSNSVIMWSTC